MSETDLIDALAEALTEAKIANAKADLVLSILQPLCYTLAAKGDIAYNLHDEVDRLINDTEEFGSDIEKLAIKELVDGAPPINSIDYQVAKNRDSHVLKDQILKDIKEKICSNAHND